MIDAERLARARRYDSEGAYLRDAKNKTGRYTATQSGAYYLAAQRAAERNNARVLDRARSMETFEKEIDGKEVK